MDSHSPLTNKERGSRDQRRTNADIRSPGSMSPGFSWLTSGPTYDTIISLQRLIGNKAVQRLVGTASKTTEAAKPITPLPSTTNRIQRLSWLQVKNKIDDYIDPDSEEGQAVIAALVKFTDEWESNGSGTRFDRMDLAVVALDRMVWDIQMQSAGLKGIPKPESPTAWVEALQNYLPKDRKQEKVEKGEINEKDELDINSNSPQTSETAKKPSSKKNPSERRKLEDPEQDPLSDEEQGFLLTQLITVLEAATADLKALQSEDVEPSDLLSVALRELLEKGAGVEMLANQLKHLIARIRREITRVQQGQWVLLPELFHALKSSNVFMSIASGVIETRMERDNIGGAKSKITGAYVGPNPIGYGSVSFGFSGGLPEQLPYHNEPGDQEDGNYGFIDPLVVNPTHQAVSNAFFEAIGEALGAPLDIQAIRAITRDLKLRWVDGKWAFVFVGRDEVIEAYFFTNRLNNLFPKVPEKLIEAAVERGYELLGQVNKDGIVPGNILGVSIIAPREEEKNLYNGDLTLEKIADMLEEEDIELKGGSLSGVTEMKAQLDYLQLVGKLKSATLRKGAKVPENLTQMLELLGGHKGGNCLMDAVLEDETVASDVGSLREMIANEIRLNFQDYIYFIPQISENDDVMEDVENAAAYLEQPGNWAANYGDLAPMALANALGRLIIILNDGNSVRATFGPDNDPQPIFIYYNGWNHYTGTRTRTEKEPEKML